MGSGIGARWDEAGKRFFLKKEAKTFAHLSTRCGDANVL
jgi:hypothetical protein